MGELQKRHWFSTAPLDVFLLFFSNPCKESNHQSPVVPLGTQGSCDFQWYAPMAIQDLVRWSPKQKCCAKAQTLQLLLVLYIAFWEASISMEDRSATDPCKRLIYEGDGLCCKSKSQECFCFSFLFSLFSLLFSLLVFEQRVKGKGQLYNGSPHEAHQDELWSTWASSLLPSAWGEMPPKQKGHSLRKSSAWQQDACQAPGQVWFHMLSQTFLTCKGGSGELNGFKYQGLVFLTRNQNHANSPWSQEQTRVTMDVSL